MKISVEHVASAEQHADMGNFQYHRKCYLMNLLK